MRSRAAIVTAVLLTLAATPAVARVISYAPYSNVPAEPGVSLRSSRWFVLLEGRTLTDRQAVLYNAHGEVEPRVVYPNQNHWGLRTAAVHEPQDGEPMLLVERFYSRDGGQTWIDTGVWPSWTRDEDEPQAQIDFGGPFSNGMLDTVQIGNDLVPFVFEAKEGGVYAISANGTGKWLAGSGQLIGRNRTGDRFLLLDQRVLYALTSNGDRSRLVDEVPPGDEASGWIAPDGSAYVQVRRGGAWLLFQVRNRRLHFIAGPYDATLYPRWDPEERELRSFAVPTHDYRGAWILQRDEHRPTTLLHYDGRTLQTQWSDPAGPEVEALIAGDSGETLLIQVHVPRINVSATPFIDPALAVWRTGQPHPSSYDELYLNEEPNKGFVHVDVDALAAGQPFVFSSGFVVPDEPEEGPVSPPVGGGGDVFQEWGVVRGSLKQRLVLPAVAKMRGAFGSEWATDVTIYNPLDEPQSVLVTFVPMTGAAASLVRRPQTIELAPREIKVIPDVLNNVFLVAGTGGTLYFDPEVGVNVFARTYHRGPNGTAGYGMGAIDVYNASNPRFPVAFSGAFPGAGFRTNVLVTDTSGRGTAVKLHAFGRTGRLTTFDDASATAAPLGVLQRNRVAVPDASALVIEPTRGTAIATVIAIDNRTNDATYFPPELTPTTSRVIPFIANVNNADGTPRLRSDLYLFNPDDQPRAVTLEVKVWDKPVRRIVTVTLAPREARVVENPLQTIFGMFGIARLRYSGAYVTSRSYKVAANGGTYGTLVPSMNNFQIATPGDTLEILGISGGNAFRTHLALIEVSPANTFRVVTLRIRIFDERHRELDSFMTTLDSTYGVQIDDLFALHGVATPKAAMIAVEVLNGGSVAAFATLEDKGTGDWTYLPANLGAK